MKTTRYKVQGTRYDVRFNKFVIRLMSFVIIVYCLLFTVYCFGQDSSAVRIQIGFTQTDTSKMLTAKVAKGDSVPVKDVEVHFYIKRMFGLLPVESTLGNMPTDKNGETSIDLPKMDYLGDTAGNVVVIAKIEDDENYGNVETQATMKIGTPLVIVEILSERVLWGVKSPWGIILFFVIVIGGVWCTYCYVAFLVYKIKKAGQGTI